MAKNSPNSAFGRKRLQSSFRRLRKSNWELFKYMFIKSTNVNFDHYCCWYCRVSWKWVAILVLQQFSFYLSVCFFIIQEMGVEHVVCRGFFLCLSEWSGLLLFSTSMCWVLLNKHIICANDEILTLKPYEIETITFLLSDLRNTVLGGKRHRGAREGCAGHEAGRAVLRRRRCLSRGTEACGHPGGDSGGGVAGNCGRGGLWIRSCRAVLALCPSFFFFFWNINIRCCI